MAGSTFVTGLGTISNPNDPTGMSSTARVDMPGGESMTISVDHASGQAAPSSSFNADAKEFSGDSGIVQYETLFEDLDIQAFPVYNFWTPDEMSDDKTPRGNRSIDELPRFVKVSWMPAPVLNYGNKYEVKPIASKDITPVTIGLEIDRFGPLMHYVKGIDFKPAHMQRDENFSIVAGSLANDVISPGVIETSVMSPTVDSSIVPPGAVKTSDFDEEAFLRSHETDGMSLHEIIAQVQSSNGTIGGSSIDSDAVSPASYDRAQSLSGQFVLQRSVFDDTITSANSQISCVANVAYGKGLDPLEELASNMLAHDALASKESTFVKVNFADARINGAVSEKKVNSANNPESAETIVSIAQVIPYLQMMTQADFQNSKRSVNVPSFPSPDGLDTIEYVGYVMQKFVDTGNGCFRLIEEIEFPSREYKDYIDTKVAYGKTYRYRIQSIVRWTRPANVGALGSQRGVVQQDASQTSSTAKMLSSYFRSSWSRKSAYAMCIDTTPPDPPDEMTVRPDSPKKRIVVSFKLPGNPQRDICKMSLFKKTIDSDGEDVDGGWKQISMNGMPIYFAPGNVCFIDTNVEFDVRYAYAATCYTHHNECSKYSDQVAARLNSDFKNTGEHAVDFMSCGGVDRSYSGAFSVLPYRRTTNELIVRLEPNGSRPRSSFSVSGRTAIGRTQLTEASYLMRVESLDTGERSDTLIDVSYSMKDPMKVGQTGSFVAESSWKPQLVGGVPVDVGQRVSIQGIPLPGERF